ncbi:histidine kinase dimerization/phospho-acceptor domain-containing protein, partial [Rubrivirga sp.]|uniref:histidine kinase dimerization/phospho-acceptor domain-containing protein n=1 Tax=Rubrivirga sp. TaxID=1885344 RepID=UPI003C749BC3
MRALVYRLVPPTDDVGAFHQGTLLVVACFVTGLFSAFYAVLDAAFGLWIGTAVMTGAAGLFLGLAPVFRRTGSIPIVVHSFLAVGTLAVLANAHLAGGAEVLPWLAVVPLAAVLLTDGHRGLVWGVVAVALAAGFAVLEGVGYAYPVVRTPQDSPVWTALVRAGLPLLVFLLARVFCHERARALATISAQKAEIQDALDRLEETKARLVQRETLAALGQVTAGIAHEVKNPLTFITGFSELNRELAAELRGEAEAGRLDGVVAVAAEIEANAERVRQHGERADA